MVLRWGLLCALGSLCLGCPLFAPPQESTFSEAGEDALNPPVIQGAHLFRFAHITDTQLVDDESPARTVLVDSLVNSAWRPQEAHGTQTLDATLRVINDYHMNQVGGFPIDFLVATGDLADCAQKNEIRWFIDVMDGKAVLPDSGTPDGQNRPVAPADNPKLAFQAEGLHPDIPWYTVFGNHDGLAVGVFPISDQDADPANWYAPLFDPVANVLGFFALSPPVSAMMPTLPQSPAAIFGTEPPMNPSTLQLLTEQLFPDRIVPDPDRHFLNQKLFIKEHFDTSTFPVGHGYTDEKRVNGQAFYSARPINGVPLRLVVLDTVSPLPVFGFPVEYGVLTRDQFETFVKPEFEAAKTAGEWVIVLSHHPSSDFGRFYPGDNVSDVEFRDYLSTQSNIIAHVCGHVHVNKVYRIDGAYPYFEILTSSIIDYPQEARILDAYYDQSTETLTLVSDLISHMDNPTVLSQESFRRSVVDKDNRTGFLKQGMSWNELVESTGAPVFHTTTHTHAPSSVEKFGMEEDRHFVARFHRPNPTKP
ncbi:MAG: hypothetical protein AMXMBFR84_11390 [Candidatus Hydrogenedentota bacterium]